VIPHGYQREARCRDTSYNAAVVALAALSELALPTIGMRTT
jgi:hypothetical protein